MLRLNAVSTDRGYGQYLEQDLADWSYWMGRGAELLELKGQTVDVAEFEQLQRGVHPRTGEVLRARQMYDLTNESGRTIARSRGLYDVVIFAPKSVSILATSDERLIDAHKAAAQSIWDSMEGQAWTRVRRDGMETNRETKNLIAAPWLHLAARPVQKGETGDPLIHTHLTLINMTFDPQENRWKALQAVGIYQGRHQLTEQYRTNMKEQVQRLGYGVAMRPERSPNSFEIEGVSRDLMKRFSQRSELRDQKVAEWQRENPEYTHSERVAATILRRERLAKNFGLSLSELRDETHGRLSDREHAQLEAMVGHALERSERLAPTWVPPDRRSDQKPELLREIHPKLSLDDSPHFEPGLKREDWEYGEGYRHKRGQRMGM